MTKMQKATKRRKVFFLVWLICYLIIIASYLSTLRGDDAINFELDIKPILEKTSLVILPQLGLMSFFFFRLKPEEIRMVLMRNNFSKLAFVLATSYILIFTLFVVVTVFTDVVSGNLHDTNKMILFIMGILGVFVNGPITYLYAFKPPKDDMIPATKQNSLQQGV